MASPVTASDLINGVGEFLKLPEHVRKSLFPKEDRVKDISDAIAPYNTAAWEQAVNDARDIHNGVDLTATMDDDVETIVKAAVCNLIVGLMFDQNALHEKDPNALKAKKYFTRYKNIIARTRIATASGRIVNIGRSKRLVQT